MRTTVVSGMLGSGKTTFIGNLLKDSSERTVVIGEALDGEALRRALPAGGRAGI